MSFASLSKRIHIADLDRVYAAFEEARLVTTPYEIDFRVRTGAEVRWFSARGQGEGAGMVDNTMFAVVMDVTQRKAAEEAEDLIAAAQKSPNFAVYPVAGAFAPLANRDLLVEILDH